MTSIRNKNAWIWLAIATVAVVSLARIESGPGSSVYTNPVLAMLAGHPDGTSLSTAGGPQIVKVGSARHGSGVYLHDASSGAWTAMLPVLFIGLLAPLSLISPRSILSLGSAPCRPEILRDFPRPPPPLL